MNDGPADWRGTVRYGICMLAGGLPLDAHLFVTVPANTSGVLAAFPAEQWKAADRKSSGAFAILEQNGNMIAWHRLFTERFKSLTFSKPVVKIIRGKGTITFQSSVYVWGACIDTDGEKEIPDNCFDLLPGIPNTLPWTEKETPKLIFTGNSLFQ